MSTPPTPRTAGPAQPPGQSLRRTSRNRILLGLLGGIARSLNTSATMLRVVVLLASMVMLPLLAVTYIVAAAIVPRDDGSVILGDGPADTRDVVITVVAALLAAPLVFGAGGHGLIGPFFGWPIVLAGTGVLIAVVVTALMRGDDPDAWQPGQTPPAAPGAARTPATGQPGNAEEPATAATASAGAGDDVAAAGDETAVQTEQPAPQPTFVQSPGPGATATFTQPAATGRRRGGLAAPIFAALLLIPAFFVLLLVTGVVDPTWTAWAVMLAVMAVLAAASAVAAAILRPSYLGPGLLILFAAAAGISAIGVRAVGPLADDGFGARTYRPVSAQELRNEFVLGIGEMRIDLRDTELRAGATTRIRARLGIGELRVIVPAGVRVVASPGSSLMHLGDLRDDRRGPSPRRGARTVELDVHAKIGEVIVLSPDRNGDLRQIANETAGFWSRNDHHHR